MSTVNTKVGSDLEIRLESFGGSGYVWEARFNAAALDLRRKKYVPASGESVGGGGFSVFIFKALQPGSFTIEFELRRAWQPQSVAERKQYEICVTQ